MAAERQCRTHIVSHPNSEFTVKIEGLCPAPVIKVAFQPSLIDRLPLLKGVQHSTTNDSNPAEIELPCSPWGLASLLILLEGSVSVEQWFGGDPGLQDPALPVHTQRG